MRIKEGDEEDVEMVKEKGRGGRRVNVEKCNGVKKELKEERVKMIRQENGAGKTEKRQ